jgi:hypothetical protein
MKKIINPWKDLEGYNCFGCAPNNEAGVRMEFYEDGDEIVSIWKPRPEYQGWIDTLHGGIQAVLLDEICAWVVLRKLQTTGVTSFNFGISSPFANKAASRLFRIQYCVPIFTNG